MKAKLSQFRVTEYAPGSRPTPRTLRKQIDNGQIPGGYRAPDGRYYVDLDVYNGNKVLTDTLSELLRDPVVAEAVQ